PQGMDRPALADRGRRRRRGREPVGKAEARAPRNPRGERGRPIRPLGDGGLPRRRDPAGAPVGDRRGSALGERRRRRGQSMKDWGPLTRQAEARQDKLAVAQAKLAELPVEGTSGGGMVKLTLKGSGELAGVEMDESLLAPGEGEVIADLLIAAHADAKRKL